MNSEVKHQIKWFVWAGDQRIPHTANMRGSWGWDAECSCGWATHTGGAIRARVLDEVAAHKWDVANGFWHPQGIEFSPAGSAAIQKLHDDPEAEMRKALGL